MTSERFQQITGRYAGLKVAVVGDFCLDRYFEIDPAWSEKSIETGLEVYNVARVRGQPGAAGTVLNNLVALGIGEILPVGFCGEDGEGYTLNRALAEQPKVNPKYFLTTDLRVTFTYSKPLIMVPGKSPRELNRLDQKNWTSTPPAISDRIVESVRLAGQEADAVVVLEQVDRQGTGVINSEVLEALGRLAAERPAIPVLADSRRGLGDYPALDFKMNQTELGLLVSRSDDSSEGQVSSLIGSLAERNQRKVFVTQAEKGIIGAEPGGETFQVPGLPTRGEIDIVGAGDAVMANLAAALAAGAETVEAMELAMAAAHVVVHQLGTTGKASCEQLIEAINRRVEVTDSPS